MAVQTMHPIKTFTAGEALEAFRRVKLSSGSGTSVVYADAQDKAIGVTCDDAANGAHVAVRLLSDSGTFKVTAAGAFSIGARLHGADDGKVDDALDSGPGEFVALEAATDDDDIIEARPLMVGEEGSALLYAQAAAGTALTNSTTETALATKTINGADLKVGDVIEVIAAVDVTAANSTDTLTLDLMLGTEQICSTGAIDVAADDIGFIHAFITIRAAGAGGSVVAAGHQVLDAAGTLSTKFIKDAAAEDLSGDVVVQLDGTWSVANAGNSCACETFIVKIHRQ